MFRADPVVLISFFDDDRMTLMEHYFMLKNGCMGRIIFVFDHAVMGGGDVGDSFGDVPKSAVGFRRSQFGDFPQAELSLTMLMLSLSVGEIMVNGSRGYMTVRTFLAKSRPLKFYRIA